MVFGSKLVICAIFAFVQFVRSDKIFPNQYLGRYLNDTEYKSREKCDTTVCLLDADLLIYAATRNGLIKPCDDFKTFAMGEFYLHRKKNDRYFAIGFYPEIYHLEAERFKIVLNSRINKDDLRVHKFLKSHFQKCAELGQIRKHGGYEVLAYLNSLGGSPLTANETWDETKFDVGTLLELDPWAFDFFTNRQIARCNVSRYFGPNYATEPICLNNSGRIRAGKIDLLKVLQKFKFDEIKQQTSVDDFEVFIKIRNSEIQYDNSSAIFIQIKHLSIVFPHVNINWLKLINGRLFSTSQITEDEEIFVANPDFLNQTLLFLSTVDKGVIANAFAAYFLIHKRDLLYTHFLTTKHSEMSGIQQNRQRFETCIYKPRAFSFQLAIDSLLAKEKFNKELQNVAKEFIMEAVVDFTSEIKMLKTSTDRQELVKQELIEKLQNIQLQVMFLDEVLNDSIIDKLYDEPDFDETMSLFDLELAMEAFYHKFNCERSSSLIRTLNRKVGAGLEYFVEENILVVPAAYTLPPFFVPKRSRFFNVATLYTKVHIVMFTALTRYVFDKMFFQKHEFYEYSLLLNWDLDNFDLADKYYVKWEENGGKELQLSSFKLTNRQMLWLCIANVYAIQYHSKSDASNNAVSTRLNDNFHISYKVIKSFREAFQCDELTRQEEDSYYQKIRKNSRSNQLMAQ